jgi:hypothetical protein
MMKWIVAHGAAIIARASAWLYPDRRLADRTCCHRLQAGFFRVSLDRRYVSEWVRIELFLGQRTVHEVGSHRNARLTPRPLWRSKPIFAAGLVRRLSLLLTLLVACTVGPRSGTSSLPKWFMSGVLG